MDKIEEIRARLQHEKSILEGAEYKGMVGPEEEARLKHLREDFEDAVQSELNK